jgi:hypothetical protein
MTLKVLRAFTMISGNAGMLPQNMDLTSLPKFSATYYSKPCLRTVQAILLLSFCLPVLDNIPSTACGSYRSDECHDDG